MLLRVSQLTKEDRQYVEKLRSNKVPRAVDGILPGDDRSLSPADLEATTSLMQITLALNSHVRESNWRYPERAIYSKDETPLRSWRVVILPYLGEFKLYGQFRLEEPWDSEHNKKLIEKIPLTFSVGADIGNPGRTRFLVPVGEATMWAGRGGFTIQRIPDGTSKTIAVIQVARDRAVTWTEPKDWELDLQDLRSGLVEPNSKGFFVGFADGHVGFLPNELR